MIISKVLYEPYFLGTDLIAIQFPEGTVILPSENHCENGVHGEQPFDTNLYI